MSDQITIQALQDEIRSLQEANASLQQQVQSLEADIKRERYFQTLVEHSTEAIARFDATFRILYVNPAAATASRVDADELPGSVVGEHLLPTEAATVVRSAISQVFENGQNVRIEIPIVAPDGVMRFFDAHFVPEVDHGLVQSVLMTSRDLTDIRQTQQSLEEKNKILDHILNVTPIINIVFNEAMQYLYISTSGLDVTDQPLKDVQFKTWREIGMSAEYSIPIEKEVQQVFQTGQSLHNQRYFPSREGIGFYDYDLNPIFDDDGNVELVLLTAHDITPIKETQDALHESEEMYRLLAENMSDLIVLSDLDGVFDFVSPACQKMLGYSPDEMVGINGFKNIHPEDVGVIQKRQSKLRQLSEDERRLTYRVRHKAGYYIWVESISRLIEWHGEPKILISVRDVQDRVAAERERNTNLERYRAILQGNLDAVFVMRCCYDENGEVFDFCINDINQKAAEQLGMTSDQLLNNRICELFPVNREAGYFDKYKSVYLNGQTLEEEYSIPSEHTAPGHYYHQVIPLSDGVAIINRDISARKAQEKALKESEERFRMISELVSDYAYVAEVTPDQKLRLLWSTQGFCQRSGIALDEQISAVPDNVIVYEPDVPILKKRVAKLLANEVDVSELRVTTAAGEIRWLRTYARPMWDEQEQRVTHIYGAAQDLTEQRRAEQARHRSEERFRAVWEIAADAMALSDPDGIVLEANQAYLDLYGLTAEEVIGKNFSQIFEPEQRAAAIEQYRAVFNREEVPPLFESTVFSSDGSERVVESRIGFVTEKGQRTAMLSIVRDITERKKAERDLFESENKWRSAINNTLFGVALIDIPSMAMYFNSKLCDMLGYTAKELRKMDMSDYSHPEDFAREAVYIDALRTGRMDTYSMDKRFIRKDGSIFWGRISGTIVRNQAGDVTLGIVFVEDVSEQIRIQEELKQRENLYREIVSTIPDGITMIREGHVEFISDRACEIFGYPLADLEEKTSLDFADPSEIERLIQFRHEAKAHPESTTEIEFWIRTKTGEKRYIRNRYALIELEKDQQTRLVVTTDMTRYKLAQDALRESEERYRLLAENTSDGVALFENNKLTYMSPSYANMYGWQLDDFKEGTLQEILEKIHPDDRDHILREVLKGREQKLSAQSYTYRILAKNGGYIWIEDMVNRFFDEKGVLTKAVISSRDITDRILFEQALQRSEKRYRSLVEKAPIGILSVDMQGNIQDVNPALAQILGAQTPEDSMAFNILTLPTLVEAGISADFEYVMNHLEPISREKAYVSYWGKRSFLRYHLTPLFDDNDVIRGVMAIVEDVSKRKEAEDKFQVSQQQLHLALEAAGYDLWELNLQTYEVTRAATRALLELGYDPDQMPASIPEQQKLMHPDDLPALNQAMQDHMAGKTPTFHAEHRWSDVNGEWHWFTVSGKIVEWDDKGQPLRMTGVSYEITKRKEYEEHLKTAREAAERANKAKDEFLAHMSHELRTPLNGILGYAQLLQKSDDLTANLKNGLTVIERSGHHLLNLINDILDFSKIEAGKIELELHTFQFRNFLSEIVDMMGIRAHQKSINFRYEPAPNLPNAIRTDERFLRQVLLNLLSNAIKFTDTGTVTFRIIASSVQDGTDGDHTSRIRFVVEDTGIGIDNATLQEIFTPFRQLAHSTRSSEGTGLGLTISQRLVRMLGSEIEVESTPGTGSTFAFELELMVLPSWEKDAVVTEDINLRGYAGPRLTALIVDDIRENREVLDQIMTELGFNTINAADGLEAIDKVRQAVPDIIFLDLLMPRMDGYSTARTIREMDLPRQPVMIAISANTHPSARYEAMKAGCKAFLPKPIRMKALNRVLHTHLDVEWTVGHAREEKPAVPAASEVSGKAAPTLSMIEELLGHAQRGDVVSLQTCLNQYETKFPQHMAFITEMRQLVDAFLIQQTQKRLEWYRSQLTEAGN